MHIKYGVEADPLIFEVPEFEELLSFDPKVTEVYDNLYIYNHEKNANLAVDLLKEAELYENIHPLIVLDNGQKEANFFDYGFIGEKWVYLYKELITAFSLDSKDSTMLEMAKLQLTEHLVYSSMIEQQEVFFVDHQLDCLMIGISKAYNCEVRFLDLDKQKKNL